MPVNVGGEGKGKKCTAILALGAAEEKKSHGAQHFYANLLDSNQLRPSLGTSISHFPLNQQPVVFFFLLLLCC